MRSFPPNGSDQLISTTVIETVAAREGVDPIDLDTPLFDVLDPDALDALFSPIRDLPQTNGRVTFRFCGHEITVYSDGRVTVDDPVRPFTTASASASDPATGDD